MRSRVWWCQFCRGYDRPDDATNRADWDYDLLRPPDWLPDGGLSFKGGGPPFFGMELEYTDDGDGQEAAVKYLGEDGQLGWLKEDGSVHGFEAVTHPMTYGWAIANWCWPMLPALGKAGSYVDTDENGLHIHVGLEGFRNTGHQLSWVKFFYRNASRIIPIAGRESDEWCSFDPGRRPGQAGVLKKKKLMARQRALHRRLIDSGLPETAIRDDPEFRRLTAAISGASDWEAEERYSAINLTTPYNTFEVRAFASTLDIQQAQARLGLVASTVEYTRHLTVGQVRKGGWGWGPYTAWLTEQGELYGPLLAEIERIK
jgi:hypothetical protein